MESVNKYREEIARLKNYKNEDSLNYDFIQFGVTEKYYDEVVKAISLLIDFERKYLQAPTFFNSISNVTESADGEDMKMCVLVDVLRCYDGLNHPTSFLCPEGAALMLLIGYLYGIGSVNKYEDLRKVDSKAIELVGIIPFIEGISDELGHRNTLFLSRIIEKEDAHVDTLYRMLIYNLCKKIAEVDGDISISEKEWLEEIARLDDNDVSNDIDVSMFD